MTAALSGKGRKCLEVVVVAMVIGELIFIELSV